MKSEHDKMLCYICGAAPIRRICLADQIVANGKYLFCDNCRKQDALRKHASQIYEIDSYSAPVSLLSINSTEKQIAQKIHQRVQACRESAELKISSIFDLAMGIEEKILKKVEQLRATFDSQAAQITQEELKNHSSAHCQQILKKVMTLKWIKQNKEIIQNASGLSQKIQTFSREFQEGIGILFTQCQSLFTQFFIEFNVENLFVERKKNEKTTVQQKESFVVNKNIKKIIKPTQKIPNKKPLIEDKMKTEKPSEIIKQRSQRGEDGMELQNQELYINIFNNSKSKQNAPPKDLEFERLIFPPFSVKQDKNEEVQKESSEVKPQLANDTKPRKRPSSKPSQKSQKSINDEQPVQRPPPLVLQRISNKSDYQEQEKLIINLKNIAQVFWILNQEQKRNRTPASIKDPKIKYQNGYEKIVQEKHPPNDVIDTKKTIRLESIKYLEVQQLPKRSVELFTVNIEGRQTKVKYSIQKLYQKINQMENLQQIHVFTSILFPSEEQILTVLFTCPQIKVVTFSCFNLVSKMLPRFKEMVGNQFNEEIKVLQMAGNIPFCEDIEIADLKLYYPESEKNKKVFDQKFSKNFSYYIEEQKKWLQGQINEKQKFQHRNSCWFIPHDRTEIQGERNYRILQPHQNKLLAQCFKELRSCWIPYLTTQRLIEKQHLSNIEKIQHLTLGFHYFVLQPIPEKFYFSQKNVTGSLPFCKSLTNLKSLNLINLNINQFFMKTIFCPNWKEVISLKIENCIGLSNQFFKNLPKYCPKLRNISVNNLQEGIEGDFLTKLQHLETIILPWSQLSYKRSQKIAEIEGKKKSFIQQELQSNGVLSENLNQFKLKKWKYVNLYGCSWFHTDFFALMNPEHLQHLNIGKCKKLSIQDLFYYLKRFSNLESLCLDQTQLSNKDLFSILERHPKLTRLSIAHCPNINLSFKYLEPNEVQILDRMTHLDLRNNENQIAFQYTMKMVNPKYLIMSRGFELEENEPGVLSQRQITACSSPQRFAFR